MTQLEPPTIAVSWRRLRRDLHERLHVLAGVLAAHAPEERVTMESVVKQVVERGLSVMEKEVGL